MSPNFNGNRQRGDDMVTTTPEPGGRYMKAAIVTALVLLSLALEAVVHLGMSVSIAYTHIFYLPIALAGIWFHQKAVAVAALLGVTHIAVETVSAGGVDPAAVVRAVMFVAVAYVIGSLSASRDRALEEKERKHRTMVAFISEVALRIRTPILLVQENLRDACMAAETGEMEKEDVLDLLKVQISHAESVLATLRELNQGVIEEEQDIPGPYKDFLTR
jgi:hypothetical protein